MRTAVAVIPVVLLVAGCEGSLDIACRDLDAAVSTENDARQPATTFAVGETITMRVTITHFGDKAVTIDSPLCPPLSYRVRDAASELVYQGGSDTPGAQVIGECSPQVTLEPGENVVQAWPWDQQAIAATQLPAYAQVPAGEYAVTVTGTACNLESAASFTIQ